MNRAILIFAILSAFMLITDSATAGLDEIGQTMSMRDILELARSGEIEMEKMNDGSIEIYLAGGIVIFVDADAAKQYALD